MTGFQVWRIMPLDDSEEFGFSCGLYLFFAEMCDSLIE
jgi:hypothetical protein